MIEYFKHNAGNLHYSLLSPKLRKNVELSDVKNDTVSSCTIRKGHSKMTIIMSS